MLATVERSRLKLEAAAIGAIDMAITATEEATATTALPSQVARAIRTDRALPLAVRGPVNFRALRRLAAKRAGVRVGDLRKDMAAPSV